MRRIVPARTVDQITTRKSRRFQDNWLGGYCYFGLASPGRPGASTSAIERTFSVKKP
jgi:hypothetical protein